MIRVLIYITVLFTLTGCVGAGVVKEMESSTKSDVGYVLTDHGHVAEYDVELFGARPLVTESSILESHGDPDGIKILDNGLKIYSYKTGSSWRGVILFVVLPIPLVLPVGSDISEYYFNDGKMVEYHWKYGWLQNFATCGIREDVCSYHEVYKK